MTLCEGLLFKWLAVAPHQIWIDSRPLTCALCLCYPDIGGAVTFKPLLRQGRRCASYASLAPPLQLHFPCTGTAVPTWLQAGARRLAWVRNLEASVYHYLSAQMMSGKLSL